MNHANMRDFAILGMNSSDKNGEQYDRQYQGSSDHGFFTPPEHMVDGNAAGSYCGGSIKPSMA
jgi:hypothetical protein